MFKKIYKTAEIFFLKNADEKLLRVISASKNSRLGALSTIITPPQSRNHTSQNP